MKYKVGDKVVMKKNPNYNLDIVEYFRDHPDMILTIKEVREDEEEYIMEELHCHWQEDLIERGVVEEHLTRPVVTRFELMDFSDEV
jgi:hypothetical protein